MSMVMIMVGIGLEHVAFNDSTAPEYKTYPYAGIQKIIPYTIPLNVGLMTDKQKLIGKTQ